MTVRRPIIQDLTLKVQHHFAIRKGFSLSFSKSHRNSVEIVQNSMLGRESDRQQVAENLSSYLVSITYLS